jgi:hypothetical protein
MSDNKNKTAAHEREEERQKTELQKAEDVAYTINHAISCGLTDIAIQPYVGVWTINAIEKAADAGKFPSWLKWIQNLFEHPHNHDEEACTHKHHKHEHKHEHHKALKAPSFWKNVAHWTSAEFFGDVGAVPATVLVQRLAPGLMHDIRKAIEPIAEKGFRKGAHHASIAWAQKNGYGEGSAEQKAKENELYEYEMKHLPQAVMWNVFAWPTNVLLQRYVFKHPGHEHSLAGIAVGKTFGALVSNTALIGGRAVMPDVAHRWDVWNSENVIVPTTKVLGGVLGVDHETSERVAQRHAESEGKGWKHREETKRNQTAASTIISTS